MSQKLNLCENPSEIRRSGKFTDCNSSFGSPINLPLNMALVFVSGSWPSGADRKTS